MRYEITTGSGTAVLMVTRNPIVESVLLVAEGIHRPGSFWQLPLTRVADALDWQLSRLHQAATRPRGRHADQLARLQQLRERLEQKSDLNFRPARSLLARFGAGETADRPKRVSNLSHWVHLEPKSDVAHWARVYSRRNQDDRGGGSSAANMRMIEFFANSYCR